MMMRVKSVIAALDMIGQQSTLIPAVGHIDLRIVILVLDILRSPWDGQ